MINQTRIYGPLRGPCSSSCGGLRPSTKDFFGLWAKKRAYSVVQQTTTVSLTGFPVLRTLYKPMYMHKRTKSQNCEFCVL